MKLRLECNYEESLKLCESVEETLKNLFVYVLS